MLLHFSVENYRSLAERQTLSLTAGSEAAAHEHWSVTSDHPQIPSILRSACLLGANGSGKSSFVEALAFFKDFIENSVQHGQQGRSVQIPRFKLETDKSQACTVFEIYFLYKTILYKYGFCLTPERVLEEWLDQQSQDDEAEVLVFYREFLEEQNAYSWDINPALVTETDATVKSWQEMTRDNALFLSLAMALNSQSFAKPFEWLREKFQVFRSVDHMNHQFTFKFCEDNNRKSQILHFLKMADTHIKDIKLLRKSVDLRSIPDKIISQLQEGIKLPPDFGIEDIEVKDVERVIPRILHENDRGEAVYFDLSEESDGTQRLFVIAGIWLKALEEGVTLVIDELHNNIHPHALRFLIDYFNDPLTNPYQAQLIFTSHETFILKQDFMHPDQIWLFEKNDQGKSHLFCLSDFDLRTQENLQKAYLEGRFGAVPKLGDKIYG